jgi:hypothetical protein
VQLEIALSVHPTVPWLSPSVQTRSTIAPTLAIKVPSVHPKMSFLFFPFLFLTLENFGMWYFCIHGT